MKNPKITDMIRRGQIVVEKLSVKSRGKHVLVHWVLGGGHDGSIVAVVPFSGVVQNDTYMGGAASSRI